MAHDIGPHRTPGLDATPAFAQSCITNDTSRYGPPSYGVKVRCQKFVDEHFLGLTLYMDD